MTRIDFVEVAFDSLRINRLRSALTMLGVIIGVAAVILLVAPAPHLDVPLARQSEAGGLLELLDRLTAREVETLLQLSSHPWQE